jgi:hypothetical protein
LGKRRTRKSGWSQIVFAQGRCNRLTNG